MRLRTPALASLLLFACANDEPALPTEPAPEAMFGGCDELSGSTCTLEAPHPVRVWLDVHGATPLRVLIDDQSIPSAGVVVQGGVRLEFDVPEGASAIRAESTDARWDPPVEVTLAEEPRSPTSAGGVTTAAQ